MDPLDLTQMASEPRALAAAMPDLMVEARRLAASLIAGIHGRKRAGAGQAFWQFRQYGAGDASSRIDWRRSARGDTLYVREMEWESAHTVRLSVDMSSSMRFASPGARQPKRDRAVLMALVLASLLVRGGERIGLVGGERPKTGEAALRMIAQELLARDTSKAAKASWADMAALRPREDVIILSDFLFEGRTRFEALGRSGQDLVSGRAENWQEAYQALFAAFTQDLRQLAQARGWSHTLGHTDRPAALSLLTLHEALSRSRER